MKPINIILPMLILTLALLLIASTGGGEAVPTSAQYDYDEAAATPLTLLIDPGHGGVDGGAVAGDGTVEKDINLSLATKLRDLLRAYGFNTMMTRTLDCSIHDDDCATIHQKKVSDLKNRLSMLNRGAPAALISIHQNADSNPTYHGAQVFFGRCDPTSESLASAIQTSIKTYAQPDNCREIKGIGSEIYLLHNAEKPAVMVECGFITNPDELAHLKSNEYQNTLVAAIARGIISYYYGGTNNG